MAAAKPPRAIIFDLGGTLVDFAGTGETWWDVERRAFVRTHNYLHRHHADAAWEPFFERIKQLSDEYWLRATAGETSFIVDHLVIDACRDMAIEPSDELVRGCVDAFCGVVADACYPFDDSRSTLEACKARGLKIGLVSNTMIHGRLHRDDMRRFHLLDFFDHTVFSGDFGFWKPDARIFWHCLETLDRTPEETVFVGDRIVDDIGGAQALGMRGVLKQNLRTDNDYADPRALTIEPTARIHDLHELIPLLDGWLAGS